MMLLDAFMDCDTSTLLTVTGDRSFKLWDIGVLSHHQNSNDNHTNSANNDSSSCVINTVSSRSPAPTSTHSDDRKKSSFFKFSSSKKGKSESSHSRSHKEIPVPSVLSGVCLIPCVGRIVQGSSLPPSLMKFVSCCILNHPRFPFGTFAIVSKSNSIGIVQVSEWSQITLTKCQFAWFYYFFWLFNITLLYCVAVFYFSRCRPLMV